MEGDAGHPHRFAAAGHLDIRLVALVGAGLFLRSLRGSLIVATVIPLSLLVAFTDLDSPDMARQMVACFGPLARRHLALLARVSDPRLSALYDQPVNDYPAMYERAAADSVISDRRASNEAMIEPCAASASS